MKLKRGTFKSKSTPPLDWWEAATSALPHSSLPSNTDTCSRHVHLLMDEQIPVLTAVAGWPSSVVLFLATPCASDLTPAPAQSSPACSPTALPSLPSVPGTAFLHSARASSSPGAFPPHTFSPGITPSSFSTQRSHAGGPSDLPNLDQMPFLCATVLFWGRICITFINTYFNYLSALKQ